ncbi:MAG: winged helix-turn-helix domain-containing protein [Betaproteobacteria bacterium]|nr:winged helix-turn-helix domain-containing protein [Betaproteobacteria bacterium]
MDADKIVDATHEAMARELGTAREVVSRHLKRFEAQGLLHLRRGKVQVAAVDALRKLGGSM